ncbi:MULTISPECIES: P22 phage major capsid protein family protein [unclassified Acinetobacter]|uniref:P22 phage major capsid protein family protein n=1 Tax=unclassified Acinetobacter TaxID=196816 RepID=UPI0015D2F4E3|nr:MULTISPECIES: P22 phage major capsid protein family protein [unclassified Acinetobacter]
MANKVLTHSMIAKEAAAMLLEKSVFIRSISREREKDIRKEVDGYKKGGKVTIRIPPVPVVTDGNVLNKDDQNINAQEQEVVLQVDTHKHVGLQFGVYERELDLANYKERFLKPAVNSLAAVVDADILKKAILTVNNFTLYGASEPHPLAPFGRARSALNRALSPDSDRKVIISSDFSNDIVDTSGTLFNPNAEIAKQYKEGYVGRARGFDFFESEHIWSLTVGQVAGMTVNGAGQKGGLLAVTGLTNGDVIEAGQVFTIPGVYMLHPLTRQPTSHLMQFVVLEKVTAGGATAALKIYPEITPDQVATVRQANATVSESPATGAVLNFIGAEGDLIEQALAYDPHAFAAAFVPIGVIPSAEGYMFKSDAFALTVQTGGDIQTLTTDTRLDVLYGFATVRGNHASRIGKIRA